MIRKKNTLLILVALFVIVVVINLVYMPVINNDFIAMDDSYYVTDNEMIKDLSVDNFFDFFHTKVVGNIQPLTMLSLSIDYNFWEFNASAYHIHNVILHILNSLLVFFFVFLLSKRKLFLAFMTSMLFAIHPLHVESVAWISERKDVLYTFYYIAGLITYLLYKDKGKANYLVYTYVLFVLSLLSKPTAVSFPIVLVILDYYLEGKFTIKQFISKATFFILSLIFGLINLKSQGITSVAHHDFAIYQKIIYSSYNIIYYLRSFFFPFNLSMFHGIPLSIPFYYYIYTILTFTLIVYILYAIIKKKHKILIFGLLFFISTIFLTLHFVAFSRTIVAERYTYMPYIGLAFSFIYLVFYRKDGTFKNLFNKVYLTWTISFLVIIIFSIMSYSYIKNDWKNSETIWTNSIKNNSNSIFCYDARSNYYLLEGKTKKAILDIQKSLSYNPNNSYATLSLAYYYYYINKYDSVFVTSDKKKNNSMYKGEFTKLRAMTYSKQGKNREASLCYDTLIESKPNNYEFRIERSKINLKLKFYTKVIEDLSVCLSLKPDSLHIKEKLAKTYSKLNSSNENKSSFKILKTNKLKEKKHSNLNVIPSSSNKAIPKIYKGKVLKVNFINKAGRKIDGVFDYFFEIENKKYFIKFSEGNVKREQLENFYNWNIQVEAVITAGLWDTNDHNVQSRFGEFIILYKIL